MKKVSYVILLCLSMLMATAQVKVESRISSMEMLIGEQGKARE